MTASVEAVDPRLRFEVTDRVIVITGGGRGLGRAMSIGLAAAGARIVACGRTQADLDDTVATIRAGGGAAIGVVADVGSVDDVQRVVSATVDEFGGIDVVVNNAAEPGFGMVSDLSEREFDRAFDVNVKGPMFLAGAARPHLARSGRGSVINVLSAAIWVGGENMALYRASKEALWGLTKVMAKEWGADGIRVNALVPGPFETTSLAREPERVERIRQSTLFKRIAAFDEIVPPVLFMASDASLFMTGSTVTLDGGVTP
jgi:NAD(P)-dependent dehydrogenase (short-subunit alcohol dehydrogenase family)